MAYTDPSVLFGQALMQRPIDTRSSIGGVADVGTRLIGAMLAKPGIEQARQRQAQAGKLANLEYANALMDFKNKKRRQNFLQSILGGQMPGSAAPPPSTWTEGDPEMVAEQPEMPQQAMTGGPLGGLTEQERLVLLLNPNSGAGLKSVFDMRAKQANAPLVTLIKPGDETSAVTLPRNDPRINDFLGQGYVKRQTPLMGGQEKAYDKKMGEYYGGKLAKLLERSDEANVGMAKYGLMRRYSADADEGIFAGTKLRTKEFLLAFGVTPESLGLKDNVSEAQAFKALQTDLLLDALGRLKGAISNKEMDEVKTLNPTLLQSRVGRELIISASERLLQREIDVANFALEYEQRVGRLDSGFERAKAKYFADKPVFEGLEMPTPERKLTPPERQTLKSARKALKDNAPYESVVKNLREGGYGGLVWLLGFE